MRPYIELVKPRILVGNLLTAVAGFFLASQGHVQGSLLLWMLLGLALVMASGCVFNNCINKESDQKMQRTKDRVLVKGTLSPLRACVFAICLGLFGLYLLATKTNLLTVVIAFLGLAIYVLYSFWKEKTVYSTWVGAVAGAVPPLVGYCAVWPHLDSQAWMLFFLLFFWQMPHFFAIALAYLDDYRHANTPVYPVIQGLRATRYQMIGYIVAFLVASALLTFFGQAGYLYLIATQLVGWFWLALGLKGWKKGQEALWGRKMLRVSLLVIMMVCIALPLDMTL